MLKSLPGAPVYTYRYRGNILRGEVFEARHYLPGKDDLSKGHFVSLCERVPADGDFLVYNDKGFLDVYIVPMSMFWRDFIATGWSADSSSMTWHPPGRALPVGRLDWRACRAPCPRVDIVGTPIGMGAFGIYGALVPPVPDDGGIFARVVIGG